MATVLWRTHPASQVLDLAVHGLEHGDNARIQEATHVVNVTLDLVNPLPADGVGPCVLHVLDEVKATVDRAQGPTGDQTDGPRWALP